MSENDLKKEYPVGSKCPIWRTPARLGISAAGKTPVWSPRAGGEYKIDDSLYSALKDTDMHNKILENDRQKIRLTTMLIDRRMRGDDVLSIDINDIKNSKVRKGIPVYERANRLLKLLVIKSKNIGDDLNIQFNIVSKMFDGEENYKEKIDIYKHNRIKLDQLFFESMAWSESLGQDEVEFIIDYLERQKFLHVEQKNKSNISCRVSIEGYRRTEEDILNPDSSQVFVAMWFGNNKENKKKMDKIYRDGIKKAIEDTGYKPMRIDQKEELNKIDDEIIAEIRRSRFLIADYTHGDTGPRGGVYYEAGFAEGLGIPVIRSCQSDQLGDLHFDTRQYYHIEWETLEELRQGLQKRILATPTLGKGPGAIETGS